MEVLLLVAVMHSDVTIGRKECALGMCDVGSVCFRHVMRDIGPVLAGICICGWPILDTALLSDRSQLSLFRAGMLLDLSYSIHRSN